MRVPRPKRPPPPLDDDDAVAAAGLALPPPSACVRALTTPPPADVSVLTAPAAASTGRELGDLAQHALRRRAQAANHVALRELRERAAEDLRQIHTGRRNLAQQTQDVLHRTQRDVHSAERQRIVRRNVELVVVETRHQVAVAHRGTNAHGQVVVDVQVLTNHGQRRNQTLGQHHIGHPRRCHLGSAHGYLEAAVGERVRHARIRVRRVAWRLARPLGRSLQRNKVQIGVESIDRGHIDLDDGRRSGRVEQARQTRQQRLRSEVDVDVRDDARGDTLELGGQLDACQRRTQRVVRREIALTHRALRTVDGELGDLLSTVRLVGLDVLLQQTLSRRVVGVDGRVVEVRLHQVVARNQAQHGDLGATHEGAREDDGQEHLVGEDRQVGRVRERHLERDPQERRRTTAHRDVRQRRDAVEAVDTGERRGHVERNAANGNVADHRLGHDVRATAQVKLATRRVGELGEEGLEVGTVDSNDILSAPHELQRLEVVGTARGTCLHVGQRQLQVGRVATGVREVDSRCGLDGLQTEPEGIGKRSDGRVGARRHNVRVRRVAVDKHREIRQRDREDDLVNLAGQRDVEGERAEGGAEPVDGLVAVGLRHHRDTLDLEDLRPALQEVGEEDTRVLQVAAGLGGDLALERRVGGGQRGEEERGRVRDRGAGADEQRVARLAVHIEVERRHAWQAVECAEVDVLRDDDVAVDDLERTHGELVRRDGPLEARVGQNVDGKVGERAEVGDGQVAARDQVGHTDVGKRTDGRQRELGDVPALPRDGQRLGELDLRVKRTGARERARERDVEAGVGDAGDVGDGDGEHGLVDNVLHDRRTCGAEQVQRGAVRLGRHGLLDEVEVGEVFVQLVARLHVERGREALQRAQNSAKHVELLTRPAVGWVEVRVRADGRLRRRLCEHLGEQRRERAKIGAGRRRRSLDEADEVLGVQVEVERQEARRDGGVAGRTDRVARQVLVDLAEEDALVRRIGLDLEQVDRRGEGVAQVEVGLGDTGLGDVGRDDEPGDGDEQLPERRDVGVEADARERLLERVDGRRVARTLDDDVRDDALHVVLEQRLTGTRVLGALRRVTHLGRHDVDTGHQHQPVDDGSTDETVQEVDLEGHVARADGDARRVEQRGVDVDLEVRRVAAEHVQVRHHRRTRVEVLQTQQIGVDVEGDVADGDHACRCAGLGVGATVEVEGDLGAGGGVSQELRKPRVLVVVHGERHVAEHEREDARGDVGDRGRERNVEHSHVLTLVAGNEATSDLLDVDREVEGEEELGLRVVGARRRVVRGLLREEERDLVDRDGADDRELLRRQRHAHGERLDTVVEPRDTLGTSIVTKHHDVRVLVGHEARKDLGKDRKTLVGRLGHQSTHERERGDGERLQHKRVLRCRGADVGAVAVQSDTEARELHTNLRRIVDGRCRREADTAGRIVGGKVERVDDDAVAQTVEGTEDDVLGDRDAADLDTQSGDLKTVARNVPHEALLGEQVARELGEVSDVGNREISNDLKRCADVARERDVGHGDATEQTAVPGDVETVGKVDGRVEGTRVGDGALERRLERVLLRVEDGDAVDVEDGVVDDLLHDGAGKHGEQLVERHIGAERHILLGERERGLVVADPGVRHDLEVGGGRVEGTADVCGQVEAGVQVGALLERACLLERLGLVALGPLGDVGERLDVVDSVHHGVRQLIVLLVVVRGIVCAERAARVGRGGGRERVAAELDDTINVRRVLTALDGQGANQREDVGRVQVEAEVDGRRLRHGTALSVKVERRVDAGDKDAVRGDVGANAGDGERRREGVVEEDGGAGDVVGDAGRVEHGEVGRAHQRGLETGQRRLEANLRERRQQRRHGGRTIETVDAQLGVETGDEAVERVETPGVGVGVEDRGGVNVVPAGHQVEAGDGDGAEHDLVDQLEIAVADGEVEVGRVDERGADAEQDAVVGAARHVDAGDERRVSIETLQTEQTTVDVKDDAVEQDATEGRVGDGLGLTLQADGRTVAEGEVGLEVLQLLACSRGVVGERELRRRQGEVERTRGLAGTDDRELGGGVGVSRVDGGDLGAVEEDGEGVGGVDDGERKTEGQTKHGRKGAREGSRVVGGLRRVDEREGADADALDRVDGLGRLERHGELEGADTGAEPADVVAVGLADGYTASLGGEGLAVDVASEELAKQVELGGVVVVRDEATVEGDDVATGGDVEVGGAGGAEIHALVVEAEVERAELDTEGRRVDERGGDRERDAASGVVAGQLEVQDLHILKVVEALDDDVLVEDEVLVGREEGEGLCVDAGAVELPGELGLRDEELCKLAKAFDVVDLKVGGLLDAGVAGGGTDVVETELAEVDLGERFGRGDLAGLGREDPVDLDGLAEVEMSGEDADLLGLTLEGEREGGVAGVGDVGLLYVEHGGVERMVGDGVEDGEQGDGQGDEEDTGGDKEAAVAELPGEVLFLVGGATSADETDGLARLVVACALGIVGVDALGSGAPTEVFAGAVAVIRHDEDGGLSARARGKEAELGLCGGGEGEASKSSPVHRGKAAAAARGRSGVQTGRRAEAEGGPRQSQGRARAARGRAGQGRAGLGWAGQGGIHFGQDDEQAAAKRDERGLGRDTHASGEGEQSTKRGGATAATGWISVTFGSRSEARVGSRQRRSLHACKRCRGANLWLAGVAATPGDVELCPPLPSALERGASESHRPTSPKRTAATCSRMAFSERKNKFEKRPGCRRASACASKKGREKEKSVALGSQLSS
ncbi:hypothetical protein L1887_52042 [Cichorium endivia]|nr:hypothetical protein L1887_52042 [Cichorium endivia]